MYSDLAVLALFLLLYSLSAGLLERSVIGGAIIYTLFGVIVGPEGFDALELEIDSHALRWLAELTLALVLFTDAANANLGVLRRSFQIPERLLLLGLPMTILAGFGLGLVFFAELAWVEIALLAVILAPTDAALGKAVVTNPAVPERLREGLNVESGLNDGICVPLLLIFLAFAAETTLNEQPV
ncbi:MAG: cation:proton antiporter, partial [Pseudomonadota bacterium]